MNTSSQRDDWVYAPYALGRLYCAGRARLAREGQARYCFHARLSHKPPAASLDPF
jgi:hypothetical protein